MRNRKSRMALVQSEAIAPVSWVWPVGWLNTTYWTTSRFRLQFKQQAQRFFDAIQRCRRNTSPGSPAQTIFGNRPQRITR